MHSYMSMSQGAFGSAPPLPHRIVPREAASLGGEDYVQNTVKFLPLQGLLPPELGTRSTLKGRPPLRCCGSASSHPSGRHGRPLSALSPSHAMLCSAYPICLLQVLFFREEKTAQN